MAQCLRPLPGEREHRPGEIRAGSVCLEYPVLKYLEAGVVERLDCLMPAQVLGDIIASMQSCCRDDVAGELLPVG